MNNWERMKAGRLYNADSKDLEQYHKFGMETCDKFNRTPLWRKKRKQRLLEKLIPSAKDGGAAIFAPFYCEYGVNIHFGKGCFVNYKCTFLDCAPITLEDGVWVGANVTIATPCRPFLSDERLPQQYPDGFHDLEYAKPHPYRKRKLDLFECNDLWRSDHRKELYCGGRGSRNPRCSG